MKNKTIIITGASGFIGSNLINHFVEQGYAVYAFARNIPANLSLKAKFVYYNLEDNSINEEAFMNSSYIIHCAYLKYSDKHFNSDEINIEGTKRLLELSRKYNLNKFIFLSSFSAHSEAFSHYGNVKLKLEKLFDENSDLILKPGLVLGNGGLFKSISDIILNNKIVPIIGDGKQPVQTIHVKDLANIIQVGIERSISGTYYLAESSAVKMNAIDHPFGSGRGKKKKCFYTFTIFYF